MEAYLYKEMFTLEQDHWWFSAKHRIILSMLRRVLPAGQRKLSVADLGCGCGRMLQLLSDRYEAIGVDASPLAVEFCKERNVTVVRGELPGSLPLAVGTFDAVLMLDVLEHLHDDVACAVAAGTLLKAGGILLLTVPAYPWLFGPHDVAHHHYRRYTRSGLRTVLRQAGFDVLYCSYFNTILFPLAVVQRAVQRIRKPQAVRVNTAVPPAPINALFRGIFAFERHLLGRAPSPFGLSVMALAKLAR